MYYLDSCISRHGDHQVRRQSAGLREVPYTHRKHAVWLSTDMERALSETAVERVFCQRRGQVLQVFPLYNMLGTSISTCSPRLLQLCRKSCGKRIRMSGHALCCLVCQSMLKLVCAVGCLRCYYCCQCSCVYSALMWLG